MKDEKNLTTKDWHRADIIAAVRKTQTNLQELSRRYGLSRTTLSNALYSPCPRYERLIAEHLGLAPQIIWPSRYHLDGTPKSGRGERNFGRPSRHKVNVSIASKSRNQYQMAPSQLFSGPGPGNDTSFDHESNQLYDLVTGLPRKVLFVEHLTQFVSYAKRHPLRKVAVLVLRLDRFEHTAEMLGGVHANTLLNEIAVRLNDRMPVAHLERDEFAVLRTSYDDVDAGVCKAADEIRDVFSKPFQVDSGEVILSCSIGVSVYPWHGEESRELLCNAAFALSLRRGHNSNGIYVYSEQAIGSERERIFLEAALHRALERNELSVYFQPQIDVRQGKIVGAETLLRWYHPEKGFVPPDRFIPIAEESGLILPIGVWTLRQACKRFCVWTAQGLKLERLSVNISARQFREKHFPSIVNGILRETGVPADCLELEITESLLLEDIDEVICIMMELRQLGVHISLDDFGTGYSNLCYINRLPIDSIKIDKSFIRDITSDQNSAAIADGILSIAHRLGLRVIAEGVETEAQLNVLLKSGCYLVQGFYFHKPMPEDVFTQTLHNPPVSQLYHPSQKLPSQIDRPFQ
ncbi:EAL domain-containing protein [Methylobacillus caricis]|uniref:EAL domain-containing protein n=1 Tax=Methylobacillus caricis TaxID=1971611 RepID=UPI001CFFE1F0|nr:EAL domain-containing protein [Methylobacillus caricis]MCB5187572.1 EAL domain-containing protein [Methylobacillus caricis]